MADAPRLQPLPLYFLPLTLLELRRPMVRDADCRAMRPFDLARDTVIQLFVRACVAVLVAVAADAVAGAAAFCPECWGA